MKFNGPIVISLAGVDPSAGAGIFADIKTFEQLKVYGMGVVTANTVQNESEVKQVKWLPVEDILAQLDVLLDKYPVNYFKVGIIENSEVFDAVKKHIMKRNPKAKIIWDPILKSSSGFPFFKNTLSAEDLLKDVFLITPNLPEFETLFANEEEAKKISRTCAIFLKGGHSKTKTGTDYLFHNGKKTELAGTNEIVYPKHGSGCVLSSAITAYLAKGYTLEEACEKGKRYIEHYLASNPSLLGWHTKQEVII